MVLPGATRGATHPMIPSYLDIRSQQMQPNLCSYSLEQARHKSRQELHSITKKNTKTIFCFEAIVRFKHKHGPAVTAATVYRDLDPCELLPTKLCQ